MGVLAGTARTRACARKPRDASVLFGATTVEQLYENVAAIELLERLTPDELADLHAL